MSLFTYYDESEVETIDPVFKSSAKTDETRAKMSSSRMGKKHTDETLAKLSASHMGKKFSDETRAKMSAAKTDEIRAKISVFRTGKKLSEEEIRKGEPTPSGNVYHTPFGVFSSAQAAANAEGLGYGGTIRIRCKSTSKKWQNYFRKTVK